MLSKMLLLTLSPLLTAPNTKHKPDPKVSLTVEVLKVGKYYLLNRWDDDQKRNLSYCVDDSFGDRKMVVVAAMQSAAAAWANAADVEFVYDEGCVGTLFSVQLVTDSGAAASAFFPLSNEEDRILRIDTTAWNSAFSLEAILTHELGHVLGFRHEHVRPEAPGVMEACQAESMDDAMSITDYDDQSIMAYPVCRWSNPNVLRLSELDRLGAQRVYGARKLDSSDPSDSSDSSDDPSDPSDSSD